MNKLFFAFLLLLFTIPSYAQSEFTLFDIIEKAQANSPRARLAETAKENRFWQYKFFKSNYNPQLVLNGNIPGLRRVFEENISDNGLSNFVATNRRVSRFGLDLRQPIALTGGQISFSSGLDNTRNSSPLFDDDGLIRGDTITQSWRTNLFNVRLDQPIFGFNQLKWDKKTEPIRFEESKREYAEEVELISRTSVELFFDFLDAQVNLQIAESNQSNNDRIYNIEQNRYNIGTTSKDKLLQVELQKLRSEQAVESAKLDLQSTRFELNRFIGLKNDEFSLALPELIPVLNVNIDEALGYARSNRSDYLALERRRLEVNRDVAQAKANRFQVNLSASFGQNASGDTFNNSFDSPAGSQTVDIGFNVPVITWGRNKASLKIALANKKLEDYNIEQDGINFDQEVITLISRLNVLKIQLRIAKKSDEVAQERYNIALNRYEVGKIDITNLNIALQEKDTAKRSYLNALRDSWRAHYDLRRLTLYDFSNNQLLYTQE